MLLTLQLQQLLLPRLQLQLQLHHITLHCANCTAVRNNYKKKCSCDYTTLHNNTLHQLHYITVHYNYYSATLQLQLQLPHTTLHPAVVVRWPLQTLQPLQKTQLQPPFGPSVGSLCHPCITTTHQCPIFETSATRLVRYYWYGWTMIEIGIITFNKLNMMEY